MKKTYIVMLALCAAAGNLNAQVHKRLFGIDSFGFMKGYPTTLHRGFRIQYPNMQSGHREEMRALFGFYLFPGYYYDNCNFYKDLQCISIKDTSYGGHDSTHSVSRSANMITFDNLQQLFLKNGRPDVFYNGTDTISHFRYNSSGRIAEETYKVGDYYIDHRAYTYDNSGRLISNEVSFKKSTERVFTLYSYNSNNELTEQKDSWLTGGGYLITNNKFKRSGGKMIQTISNTSNSYDDTFYYNANGSLNRIKTGDPYGSNVFYYYDADDYLDSVVYRRFFQTDKVVLYWETYTPNASAIANTLTDAMIAIYPNPSTDAFQIDLKTQGTSLSILNHLGQKVKDLNLREGLNTIDSLDLPKGIYILHFDGLNRNRTIIIE